MGASQSTTALTTPGQRVSQAANAAGAAFAAAPGAINSAAQTVTALTQSAQGLANAVQPGADTLRLAMQSLQKRQPGVTGGCGCDGYFGGDDSADPAKGLREYESSLSSRAKEDVIRRLARGLKRAGIAVDPEGDLDEIVRQLVEQIPNPRNGKTFSSDAKAQEKVCRVIADVLNDEFTPGVTKPGEKFIDTSVSTAEMCRSVGEWAHSFAAGVNTEFLAVHASVRNSLRTIEVLDEIMREVHAKISAQVEKSGDPKLSRELGPLNEVYARAQSERRRQEALLKNILHVQLAPAAKELEIAMRDESEQNALIKRLGLRPGTSEFADSLATAISGLGTAASIAQRVHRALKQVGLSVSQYLDSAEYADFQAALDAKIESGTIKADDLARFIEAMDTLRMAFSDRRESRFRAALEETAGKSGGADEERSSVEKRVERRELDKKIILRDFAGRMSRHYDDLLAAVKAMGPKLGRDIPLSDKTDALNEALKRLREMRAASERIELALIGMFMEAEARERKERFMSTLRMVADACSNIMELEMYRAASPYFARLKAAVDGIVKSIDYFSDVVTKKYGGQPPAEDDLEGVYGGAAEDYLPEIARSGLSFGEAVSEFAYFYYVAKIRTNLEQTSGELDSYGEKYVELLGDAVASRIYNLGLERKAIMDRLAALDPANPAAAAAPFDNNDGGKARFAAARKWVNDEYDTKVKFYNALQAVDLYMKAFTAALVKDPEAVRDIKKMLDGTQVIARWFSEQTGDSIWKAFDFMGATDFNGAVVPAGNTADVAGEAKKHYYDNVAKIVGDRAPAFPGVPEIGVAAGNNVAQDDSGAKAKKAVADAIDYFQALKNLVNAFARIGDKFGGRELRTQVFMSPAQIFKTLTDYLKQSAMSINSKGAGAAAVPVDLGLAAVQLGTGADVIAAVGAAVTPWQVYFGSVEAGVAGNYGVEDGYFVLIIKAMAAKVLTTLGVYEMFERTTPLYDLTPTRIIVGGSDDDFSDPEVLEGAAELYFRLPRLAEFYRVFLRWDGSNPAEEWRIAMLPELEGVFSGLIRLIFQKAVSPESGDYSDTEMRALVREVNSIYEHFLGKHPDRAAQAALSAFVMEINRRYGIIKRKDMQDYMSMVKLTRRGQYGDINDTNYAILPGEGEAEVDRRAPSDRFSPLGAVADAAAPFANRVGLDHAGAGGLGAGRKQMLRAFRDKFEAQFELIKEKSQFGKTSYSLLIKQAELEIRRSQTRDSKFLVAAKLIQGTNVVGTDANKSFMFHETVGVGLNLLSAFETMLRNYSDSVDRMSPRAIENAIMDSIYLNATGAGAARVAPLATFASLQAIMRARIPATADGVAGTIYDRYIVRDGVPNFAGRSGVPMTAVPDDVYAFLVAEEAAIAANQLPAGGLPSKITAVNPAVADVDVGGAAQQRYIRALRLVARLLTNYGLAMQDYVENLFDLMSGARGAADAQSLVEVRMSTTLATGVQLNFAKFRGLAEKLLTDVKYYFEIFRPFLPAATVSRFEDRTNPGSIFWLEENLVDRYFRGTDADDNASQTLEGLARRASDVYANLIRETNVPLGAVTNATLTSGNAAVRVAVLVDAVANDPTRFENYGQTFSEIVFYNAVDGASKQVGLALTGNIADQNTLGGLIQRARQPNPPAGAGAGAAAMTRLAIYDTNEQGMTRYRSLLFVYNQLIARYLAALTDTAGGQKIYLNLINSFANGVASQSVTAPEGSSFPDLQQAGGAFGFRGDPKPEAVLFQSLAWIIQRMIKNVNPNNQVPDHVVTTLTDIPMYMKEAMRINLPAFVKYFDLLAQKGDFVKQIMQRTAVKLDRPSQVDVSLAAAANVQIRDGANRVGDAVPEYPPRSLLGLQVLDGGQTDAGMKARISVIIDAIASGSYALSSSAAETLKELGDTPVYFQTQENSVEQYKMRYGKMPLMPLSLSMYFLNDLEANNAVAGYYNDLKLFPGHVLGTPGFKLMYGTRQIIMRSSPVGFEQVPGVKALLDAYNGVSSRREQIDESRYLSFVQATVGALRYITEARNLKSALSTVGVNLFSTATLVRGAGAAARNGIVGYTENPAPAGNAVFAVGAPGPDLLQKVLNIVESSNQEEEMANIAGRVGSSGRAGAGSREMERILNLIDMNVIPINVHALMRDIPLANLYNYEYTFEQMVASMYGEQSTKYTRGAGGPGAIVDGTTRTTRQMLLRLLVDPYLDVTTAMYGSETRDTGSAGFVHRIFRGDNNLGMGRPKFLSDQLFNKALFGSVYQSRRDFDEAGPAVGVGAARGQGVAAGPMQNAMRQLSAVLGEIAADRAAFLGVVGNPAGLVAANGAGANLADGALRGQVHDWIYGTAANHIQRWKAIVDRLPGTVPNPPRAALQAIADEFDAAAGGAHDFMDLLEVVTLTGDRATVVAADNGFTAAVDALFLTEFDAGTGGSVPQLITATLNLATANGLAQQVGAELRVARGVPGAWAPPGRVQTGARASKLTYLKPPPAGDDAQANDAVVEVSISSVAKQRLEAIGKERFDTRFIRNIFFITNVVRILRLKLNRELSQNRNVLVASHMSVAAGVTEYGSDPFGPNEVLGSTMPNGVGRYNDRDDFV